jgi:hypothetical protein
MYMGAEALDRIDIDGDPPIALEIIGGIAGDSATVAALLNAAAGIADFQPGLRSLADRLPPLWAASSHGQRSHANGASSGAAVRSSRRVRSKSEGSDID